MERIFALRALIAAAMAGECESVRALRVGANCKGGSGAKARVVVCVKRRVARSTAGVVAEAEPLGERCRLPRVLQGWVGLFGMPCHAPSEGMGSRALLDACLQVRWQSGLLDCVMLIALKGYALCYEIKVRVVVIYEKAWMMRSYLLHCLGVAGHAPAFSASM